MELGKIKTNRFFISEPERYHTVRISKTYISFLKLGQANLYLHVKRHIGGMFNKPPGFTEHEINRVIQSRLAAF